MKHYDLPYRSKYDPDGIESTILLGAVTPDLFQPVTAARATFADSMSCLPSFGILPSYEPKMSIASACLYGLPLSQISSLIVQPSTLGAACNPLQTDILGRNEISVGRLPFHQTLAESLAPNVLGLEPESITIPHIETSEERFDALTKRLDKLVDEVHQLRTSSTYWQSQTHEAEKQVVKWRKRARKAELKNLELNREKCTRDNISEFEQLKAENIELKRTILGYTLEAGLSQDIESPGEWGDYRFSEN